MGVIKYVISGGIGLIVALLVGQVMENPATAIGAGLVAFQLILGMINEITSSKPMHSLIIMLVGMFSAWALFAFSDPLATMIAAAVFSLNFAIILGRCIKQDEPH